MLISVVTISKNAKNTIRRCFDSILSQTYPNIEVVVVDSSDDGTEGIIEEYKQESKFPFKIIRQEPRGVGAARNAGILNANGDVVVFVDADCWISENFINEIAKHYAKSDKVLCVRTKEGIVQPQGLFPMLVYLYDRIMGWSRIPDKLQGVDPLMPRKKLYEIVGLYDENLSAGEDAELYNRVVKKLDELKREGYEFLYTPNAVSYEDKQDIGFFGYYKKCIWYGEPLANWRYFSSDLLGNTIKMFIILYFAALPIFLIVSIIAHINITYIAISLIPFFLLYLYIMIRSIVIKKFSWILFLMPILMFYKYIGLFVGFVKGIIKKVGVLLRLR
jgi:glycosyltransferase involved in cell wall biosynthesis